MDSVRRMRDSARSLGLPLMDRRFLAEHLVKGAPLGRLPAVEHINHIFDAAAAIARRIEASCRRRKEIVERLGRTCALSPDAHECSTTAHEGQAACVQELDALATDVVKLVHRWRALFRGPVPFHVDGQNVLIALKEQYDVGCEVSLVCAHLRKTSRHAAFFYVSPFDAAAQGRVRPADVASYNRWCDAVLSETSSQRAYVRDQLMYARMGLYQMRLKLPRDVARLARFPPDGLMQIVEKNVKRQLVNSFGSAYAMLARHRVVQSADVASIAKLATFSSKALHVSYFRRWSEWVSWRRERKAAASNFDYAVSLEHLRFRWGVWNLRVDLARQRARRWKPFLAQNELALLRRYTQKWFVQHSLGALSRQLRRALFLEYYRRFHFVVAAKRLRECREAETFREHGGTYDAIHAALSFACVLAPTGALHLELVAVARAASIGLQHAAYDEQQLRHSVTIDEAAARSHYVHDFCERAFELEAARLCRIE